MWWRWVLMCVSKHVAEIEAMSAPTGPAGEWAVRARPSDKQPVRVEI